MIVENDPVTLELLQKMLRRSGCYLAAARNGREALHCLAETQIDLILLDLMMPEMDGFEFLRQLRQTAVWQPIPVIVLTAKELDVHEQQHLCAYPVPAIFQKSADEIGKLLNAIGYLLQTRTVPVTES